MWTTASISLLRRSVSVQRFANPFAVVVPSACQRLPGIGFRKGLSCGDKDICFAIPLGGSHFQKYRFTPAICVGHSLWRSVCVACRLRKTRNSTDLRICLNSKEGDMSLKSAPKQVALYHGSSCCLTVGDTFPIKIKSQQNNRDYQVSV